MANFLFVVFIIWKIFSSIFGFIFNLFKYIFLSWQIKQNVYQLQNQNIQKRMVWVDEDLLHNGHTPLKLLSAPALSFNQATLQKDSDNYVAMLLAGETAHMPFGQNILSSGANQNFNNVLISGGNDKARALALFKMCTDAYSCGLPVLVIHTSNRELEKLINNSSLFKQKFIINHNSGNFIYDPFLGLSPTEAADTLIKSSPDKNIRSNMNYFALAELIAELYSIKNSGRKISLFALLNINPVNILSEIQNLRNLNLINDAEMISFKQRYTFAQNDIGGFGYLLRSLKAKLANFYTSGTQHYALNVEYVMTNRGIATIDIVYAQNTELLKMIIENMHRFIKKGFQFVACFADMNIFDYDGELLAYTTSSGRYFILSSPNIAVDKTYLDKISGNTKTFICFNHGSSSDKISEILGKYERYDISYKWDVNHAKLIPTIAKGGGAAKVKEMRVQEQVIKSLQNNQMLCYKADTNQIYITNLQ